MTVEGTYPDRDDPAWQEEVAELAYEDHFGSDGPWDESEVFRLKILRAEPIGCTSLRNSVLFQQHSAGVVVESEVPTGDDEVEETTGTCYYLYVPQEPGAFRALLGNPLAECVDASGDFEVVSSDSSSENEESIEAAAIPICSVCHAPRPPRNSPADCPVTCECPCKMDHYPCGI